MIIKVIVHSEAALMILHLFIRKASYITVIIVTEHKDYIIQVLCML